MKYFNMIGDYLTAYQFCLQHGGQLYCGNGKDSANVVVLGSKCYTFWKKDSKRLQEVENLAQYFNLPPEGQTGGRIARWVIDNLLNVPYQATFWSKTYRQLAKQGNHWHYCYCEEKTPFWGIEVDIKSAYFSSLFSFPSLLFHPRTGYLQDNNAMANLRILYKDFPKWFRLQFLGCLSAWRVFYLCRDKKNPQSQELIRKQRFFIKYNAAFNVAHRAILRNYKIMKRLHEIGGRYIRRIHTDSFFLDYDIPNKVEEEIWSYLDDKNLSYSIKGFGRAFFWDLNTGIIGNKFVGAPVEVIDLMRRDNIKMKKAETNETVFEKFKFFTDTTAFSVDINSGNTIVNSGAIEQLQLFDDTIYSI